MKLPRLRPSVFDLLNVAVAALRDGVSPLYTYYIVSDLGFTPVQVAWVVSAQSVAMFILQIPLGYLFDHMHRKRLLLAVGAVGLALAAAMMGIAETPSVWYVVGVQVIFGASLSLMALAIPAITVAETPEADLGARMARNEVCAKIGNLSALGAAGALSKALPLRQVFFLMPVLAVPILGLIGWHGAGPRGRAKKITRNKTKTDWTIRPSAGAYVLGVVIFLLFYSETGAITIFQQAFGKVQKDGASYVAWALGFGQACVTIAVLGLARVERSRGLVMTLAGAFGLSIARLFLMASGPTVFALAVGQVMDGIVTGVLVTVPSRLLARLDPKEFNVISGLLGAAATCGAMLSTLATGYLMNWFGYPQSLLAYVPPAALGLALTVFGGPALAKDRSRD